MAALFGLVLVLVLVLLGRMLAEHGRAILNALTWQSGEGGERRGFRPAAWRILPRRLPRTRVRRQARVSGCGLGRAA